MLMHRKSYLIPISKCRNICLVYENYVESDKKSKLGWIWNTYGVILFNLLQRSFVFIQITEYILHVSMLCTSPENSNK